MTRKVRFFALMLTSLIIMLIHSYGNINYYSTVKYGTLSEHFDVKTNGILFSLQHYILNNDSTIVLSENINGITLKLFEHNYYFFPLNVYISSGSTNDYARPGSLTYSGTPLSLCIYDMKNKDGNYITFFNDDRGFIDAGGNIIHLSSLLLGKQGKHIHPRIISG